MLPQSLVAPRTAGLSCSAIREILKVVSRPDMVSLAGGIPAPESFPLSIITELTQRVLDKYQSVALQYDCTEGFAPLREVLTDFLLQRGVKAAEEQILIASGSQGVLDAIGKVLIAPGDRVAVEAPTYLGALQAFNPYGPRYVRLATDDDGLIPESLEQALLQYSIKFVYLVPTFQNPTGRTLPEGRRKEIAGILQRHNVLLIEDDPYGALRYKGPARAANPSLGPGSCALHQYFFKNSGTGLKGRVLCGTGIGPKMANYCQTGGRSAHQHFQSGIGSRISIGWLFRSASASHM